MTAIAKSAKRHPAAKKCCGWEEPAICIYINTMYMGMGGSVLLGRGKYWPNVTKCSRLVKVDVKNE